MQKWKLKQKELEKSWKLVNVIKLINLRRKKSVFTLFVSYLLHIPVDLASFGKHKYDNNAPRHTHATSIQHVDKLKQGSLYV